MRKPKDRDFMRTTEDLLFCVVGYTHPADRLLSYLKYIPSGKGIWASGDQHFKRMIPYYSAKSVSDTFSFLQKEYPKYLFYSEVNDITFPAVPHTEIKKYYEPEERLKELSERKEELDELQLRAVELADHLSGRSGVPLDRFGVTGSILLGIHNVSISDVDLTIYGHRNALLVKECLIEDYDKPKSPLRRLNQKEAENWRHKKMNQFPIDYESAFLILTRKWNFGYYKAKFFSIHPIKLDSEITETYGEEKYASKGTIEVVAKVEDDRQSLFNPASYKVREVRLVKGPKVNDIEEVVSFEGFFSGLASNNESIRVKGNLETVTCVRSGKKYHRVVVGSKNVSSPEYIIPISQLKEEI